MAPSKVYSVVIWFAARRGVTVVSVVVCNLMDVRTTPCLAQELASHWGIEEQHKKMPNSALSNDWSAHRLSLGFVIKNFGTVQK